MSDPTPNINQYDDPYERGYWARKAGVLSGENIAQKQRIEELQAKLGALVPYIQEVLDIHSDPTCAEYNECDSDPCLWCEGVKAILKQEQEGEANN